MDWRGLEKLHIELMYPLLVIKGSKGFLGCGYIDINICDGNDEVCAILFGIENHDDFLDADLKFVSRKGMEIGLEVGMKGRDALEILK